MPSLGKCQLLFVAVTGKLRQTHILDHRLVLENAFWLSSFLSDILNTKLFGFLKVVTFEFN